MEVWCKHKRGHIMPPSSCYYTNNTLLNPSIAFLVFHQSICVQNTKLWKWQTKIIRWPQGNSLFSSILQLSTQHRYSMFKFQTWWYVNFLCRKCHHSPICVDTIHRPRIAPPATRHTLLNPPIPGTHSETKNLQRDDCLTLELLKLMHSLCMLLLTFR